MCKVVIALTLFASKIRILPRKHIFSWLFISAMIQNIYSMCNRKLCLSISIQWYHSPNRWHQHGDINAFSVAKVIICKFKHWIYFGYCNCIWQFLIHVCTSYDLCNQLPCENNQSSLFIQGICMNFHSIPMLCPGDFCPFTSLNIDAFISRALCFHKNIHSCERLRFVLYASHRGS